MRASPGRGGDALNCDSCVNSWTIPCAAAAAAPGSCQEVSLKIMEIVFERQVYTSKGDGTIQTVVSRDKLRSLLGQSLSMRVQFIGFRMTPNAEVVLKAWESSYSGMRPSELKSGNGGPFWTGTAIATLRPAPENITGPYGGDVEITMDIRTTTGGTMAEVDGMVVITLFVEA